MLAQHFRRLGKLCVLKAWINGRNAHTKHFVNTVAQHVGSKFIDMEKTTGLGIDPVNADADTFHGKLGVAQFSVRLLEVGGTLLNTLFELCSMAFEIVLNGLVCRYIAGNGKDARHPVKFHH